MLSGVKVFDCKRNKYYLKLRYLAAFCNHNIQAFLKLNKDIFSDKGLQMEIYNSSISFSMYIY